MENRRRDGRSMENRRRDRRFKEDRDVPVLRNVYPLPPMPNGRPLPYISAPQNYQINVPPLFAMPVFPRLGSCFGCFRESSKQRLSGTQWFPYPWGGNTGAGMKFLAPLAFELGDRFDEDMFYFPGEKRRPNTRETIIRFLKQVRESKGYDVDCRPPRQLSSPFLPINLEDVVVSRQDYYVRRVHEPALFAVETINNSMENKHFELDKILKAVDTSCMLMYLTFAAREVDLDYVRTFQAMLYVPFGSSACEVWEWKFKPDFATTSGS